MKSKHLDTVAKALGGEDTVDKVDVAEDVKNIFEVMSREEENDADFDLPDSEEEPAVQSTEQADEPEEVEEPPADKPEPSTSKGEDTQPPEPPVKKEPAPLPTAAEIQARNEEAAERRRQLAEDLERQFSSVLTDEDRDALMTEPEKVLPRLMAQASLHAIDRFKKTMGEELPQQLQRITAEQRAAQELENQFFDRWPQLKGNDKAPVVERVVRAYMAQAPAGTDPKTAIEESGAMAMVALRIPLEETAPEPTTSRKTATFTPAAPGATVQKTVRTPPPKNVYETLAEEFLEDDV